MNWRKGAPLALAFVATWQFGSGAWIQAKAVLAQVLIARAWEQSREQRMPVKPWPWADTWPVARLTAPGQGVDVFILQGADGRALAFGPGHLHGTALPGSPGLSIVGGHRDTHFRFLKDLKPGDALIVTSLYDTPRQYRVTATAIRDARQGPLLADPADDRLLLVTCYPFDALQAGGPLRYLVTAKPDHPAQGDHHVQNHHAV